MSSITISRNFKGIWIPKEIWLNQSLSYFDKLLLAEIDSLDDEINGCTASNEYFMEFFQERERKIQEGISKLKKLGYIKMVAFDGRIRTLKVVKNEGKSLFNTCENKETTLSTHYLTPLDTQILPLQSIDKIPPYNKVDNKEKIVCPTTPVGSPIDPKECKKFNTKGEEIRLEKDEMIRKSIQLKKNWTIQEMEEAWKILLKYNGRVNDLIKFIEGTIDNLRKKSNLEKLKEIKETKKCQISCHHSEGQLRQRNATPEEIAMRTQPSLFAPLLEKINKKS